MSLWDDFKGHMGPGGFAGNPLFMAGLRGLGPAMSGRGDWSGAMAEGLESAHAFQGDLQKRALMVEAAQRQAELQQMQLEQARNRQDALESLTGGGIAAPAGMTPEHAAALAQLDPGAYVRALTAKPAALPGPVQQYEYAMNQLPPGSPRPTFTEWTRANKKAGAAGGTSIHLPGTQPLVDRPLTADEGAQWGISPEDLYLYKINAKGGLEKRPVGTDAQTDSDVTRFNQRATTTLSSAKTALQDFWSNPSKAKYSAAMAALSAAIPAVAQARNLRGEPGDSLLKDIREDMPSLILGGLTGALPAYLDQLESEVRGYNPQAGRKGGEDLTPGARDILKKMGVDPDG